RMKCLAKRLKWCAADLGTPIWILRELLFVEKHCPNNDKIILDSAVSCSH
ncbi:uncharacterized protein METZ01_LOCUS449997, partial [marine metagenome]